MTRTDRTRFLTFREVYGASCYSAVRTERLMLGLQARYEREVVRGAALMQARRPKSMRYRPRKSDVGHSAYYLATQAEPVLNVTIWWRYEALAAVYWVRRNRAEVRFKKLLYWLAGRTLAQREPALWTTYTTSHRSTYQTQGFGAVRYAEQAARIQLAELEGGIVPARLVTTGADHTLAFRVEVETDVVGCEILKRRPGFALREWVRQCWARGVNPRVYAPFLPADYEEKHGLDFLGREVTPCQT